jgi:hypothetical protein
VRVKRCGVLSRAAVLLILALPACTDARSPSDAPACATEAECSKLYKEAVLRYQNCRREVGYDRTGPGLATQCDTLKAEAAALASALVRFHGPKVEPGEEDHGFEVPTLPPGTTP